MSFQELLVADLAQPFTDFGEEALYISITGGGIGTVFPLEFPLDFGGGFTFTGIFGPVDYAKIMAGSVSADALECHIKHSDFEARGILAPVIWTSQQEGDQIIKGQETWYVTEASLSEFGLMWSLTIEKNIRVF